MVENNYYKVTKKEKLKQRLTLAIYEIILLAGLYAVIFIGLPQMMSDVPKIAKLMLVAIDIGLILLAIKTTINVIIRFIEVTIMCIQR